MNQDQSHLRVLAKRLTGHAVAMFAFGVLFSVFVLAGAASTYNSSEAKVQGLPVEDYVGQAFIIFILVWSGITIVWLTAIAIVEHRRLKGSNNGAV